MGVKDPMVSFVKTGQAVARTMSQKFLPEPRFHCYKGKKCRRVNPQGRRYTPYLGMRISSRRRRHILFREKLIGNLRNTRTLLFGNLIQQNITTGSSK